jgi:hypothetical protein
MPLIYGFVSRGSTVLADYTSYSGNFATVAVQCLEKVPKNDGKCTFTADRHTFNYLTSGGYSKPRVNTFSAMCYLPLLQSTTWYIVNEEEMKKFSDLFSACCSFVSAK